MYTVEPSFLLFSQAFKFQNKLPLSTTIRDLGFLPIILSWLILPSATPLCPLEQSGPVKKILLFFTLRSIQKSPS